jgi:uncharacterized protein (DUF608 family)
MPGRTYSGEYLNYVAFPLGGIGAGMICLEGAGSINHVSVRHHPALNNRVDMFGALHLKGQDTAFSRVLEGPIPVARFAGRSKLISTGGLPRLSENSFSARFPFATVRLADRPLGLQVELTGWSPFIPGNADDSSLPVAALEYGLINTSEEQREGVFSYHAVNFLRISGYANPVVSNADGFTLNAVMKPGDRRQPPPDPGTIGDPDLGPKLEPGDVGNSWVAIAVDDADCTVNPAWFRGEFEQLYGQTLNMLWRDIESGQCVAKPDYDPTVYPPSCGGSVYVPVTLAPGERRTITVRVAWYVPDGDLRIDDPGFGEDPDGDKPTYKPWYAGRFSDIGEISSYWRDHYTRLREETQCFTDSFFASSLPAEVTEAVASCLSILKTPTVLRQTDGRLWGWEGCNETIGNCYGSDTHVWDYAQSIPHLFPDLERTFRETEFNEMLYEDGRQISHVPLPIRKPPNAFVIKARPEWLNSIVDGEGQLTSIIRVYREWRIYGEKQWLETMWPKVKTAMDFSIRLWDPAGRGVIEEPHWCTYDMHFWGADSMHASIYLAALRAVCVMGQEMGAEISGYEDLYEKGRRYLESTLFNGEYFEQEVKWEGLQSEIAAKDSPLMEYSPEAMAVFAKEGPKYQCGPGCLADGVAGAWHAAAAGLPEIASRGKVEAHLLSVYRHNFKPDLSSVARTERWHDGAIGDEGGLLNCSWPHGGRPSVSMRYGDEVWTGIEYEIASHLMMLGHVEQGLEIVRASRDRYDGRKANPFDQVESGHFYMRAMSSYALLQGISGIRYDAVDKVLHIAPRIAGDFQSFLSTATGFGLAGVRNGTPFVEVRKGDIEIGRIEYAPYETPNRIDCGDWNAACDPGTRTE